MRKQTKAVACGSTGLADALAIALKLNAHKQLTEVADRGGKGAQVACKALAVLDTANVTSLKTGGAKDFAKSIIKDGAPDPLAEKLKREDQAKTIAKLSAIIRRKDPRLLMEALQEFGGLDGLNAKRQADFITVLKAIMKTYNL